jgi:hypothetical protein
MSKKKCKGTGFSFDGLTERHYFPCRTSDKILLVLDRKTSNCHQLQMLEFAINNGIVWFACTLYTT